MPRQLIGSVVVHTFALPPKGFDPLTATQHDLERFGFPKRPSFTEMPSEAAKWVSAFRKYGDFEHIEPAFEPLEFRHAPNCRTDETSRGVLNATSTNWSGSVLFIGNNQKFAWISGTWTVPHAYPVPGKSGTQYSSAWLGIDGDGSPDVLQAGTESDSNGTAYAWFEWYPNYSSLIANFPVNPGDVITLVLCATSDTQAWMSIGNLSTKQYTNFSFAAPAGTTLVGNCAEAIVEAPTVNGAQAALPRYGRVFFDDTSAVGNNTSYPIALGTSISMVDASNNTISTPSFDTDTDAFYVAYSGT